MEMFDLHDLPIADVESRNGVELFELILLEKSSDFEDLVIESINEKLILLLLKYLSAFCLLHKFSE